MSKSLIRSVVSLGAVVVIAVTAFLFVSRDRSERSRHPAGRFVGTLLQQSDVASNSAAVQFRPNEKYRYTYGFERKILFHGLMGANPEIVYRGEFYVDVIHSNWHSSGHSYASSFEALVSEQIEGLAVNSVHLRIKLAQGGGKLEIFRNSFEAGQDSESDRQHTDVIKDLISNWAFFIRTDTVGDFNARFETLPSEDGLVRMSKIKLGYVHASNLTPEIVSSYHIVKFDPALKLPREIEGEEQTRLGSNGVSSESAYSIRFLKKDRLGNLNGMLVGLSQPEPLAIAVGGMSAHPDYASVNWPAVVSRLREIDELSSPEQLKVFGQLIHALRAHSERVSEVVALLRLQDVIKLGAQSQLFKTVIGALASVGSPEAQAAVVQIYQDPVCPISGKGAILAALTTTQAPIETSTREFLERAMKTETDRDLSHGAAFALGASLQSASPNDGAHARQAIQEAWKVGTTLSERLALLDAMGNSGQAEFLPELRQVIQAKHEDPALRVKAVFALRFMPQESGAVQILSHCSTSEPFARIQNACREILQSY